MLPVSTSCAMKTALPHKSSNTLANAPLTNPRDLSKLRVSRINTPFAATMPKLDFEDGSQRYPESNCSSVMPIVRSAASHTSDAPLLVHVSHMKLVFFLWQSAYRASHKRPSCLSTNGDLQNTLPGLAFLVVRCEYGSGTADALDRLCDTLYRALRLALSRNRVCNTRLNRAAAAAGSLQLLRETAIAAALSHIA